MKYRLDRSWRAGLSERVTKHLSLWLQRFAAVGPASQRRAVIALDSALCVLATWLAFALRLGLVYLPVKPFAVVLFLGGIGWAVAAWHLQFYRSMLRFSGVRTMFDLVWAAVLMSGAMIVAILLLRIDSLPRTMAILQPITFVGLVGISRLVFRFILVELAPRVGVREERCVVIYGAGRAGQQLALSMRHEPEIRVVGYLDDDRRMQGQRIDGRPIFDPACLADIFASHRVDEVLIALPSATRARRREIINTLQRLGVSVRALPSTAEIIAGQITFSDLREVNIEDLLGRDPVPPDPLLMALQITDQVVLVTGAGGSIGSELCRQIVAMRPRALVLVDHSEISLYEIDNALRASPLEGCRIIPELGDVSRKDSIARILERYRPDTVFHSAAYKHVPLVEANPIAGIWNNIFGTLSCCLAAENAGVRNFTLISTDKAVRPTNVMGATKRVCELVLQARANQGSATNFVMVRFGNVLGSSGSVVPRFRAQIAKGGPVTVTHADVTRYFMTIPEAAQLVIQASSMGDAGDVFVLDMGEPVRIIDLARTLIQLSHRTVRDGDDPNGEIEIVETGLRPGEKLYEELLIGSNPVPTSHPRIIKAREEMVAWPELVASLDRLRAATAIGDSAEAIAILHHLVPGFHRPGGDPFRKKGALSLFSNGLSFSSGPLP